MKPDSWQRLRNVGLRFSSRLQELVNHDDNEAHFQRTNGIYRGFCNNDKLIRFKLLVHGSYTDVVLDRLLTSVTGTVVERTLVADHRASPAQNLVTPQHAHAYALQNDTDTFRNTYATTIN